MTFVTYVRTCKDCDTHHSHVRTYVRTDNVTDLVRTVDTGSRPVEYRRQFLPAVIVKHSKAACGDGYLRLEPNKLRLLKMKDLSTDDGPAVGCYVLVGTFVIFEECS